MYKTFLSLTGQYGEKVFIYRPIWHRACFAFDSMGNISNQIISEKIYFFRGHRVMLDSDLAKLYEVETKALNLAVRRNATRFPEDFMFQLTYQELRGLRLQSETSNGTVIEGRGGRRYLPYVFTEQGVAMLSTVLRSEKAVQVNIQIIRTFVKLRELLAGHQELAKKLSQLESKYDLQFKAVFDAISQIISHHSIPRKRIIGLNNQNE